MSKALRNCLIAVGVTVALGVVLIVIGAMGHGFDKVMDVSLPENMPLGFVTYESHLVVKDGTVVDAGSTFNCDADLVQNVNIELGACNIEIAESSNDKFEVINNSKIKLDVGCDEGTLLITSKDKHVKLNSDQGKIVIGIPANHEFENITYCIGAAKFEQNVPVNCKTADLQIGAGDLTLCALRANTLNAEIGAGNVSINGGDIQNANIDIGMGNFEYKGAINGDMDLDCGMGNADFELTGKEADHNVEYDMAAGNIIYGSHELSVAAGSNKIDNGADSMFDIDCSMGTINVVFAN